jgi:ribonuclease HIII
MAYISLEEFEIPKGQSESVNRKTDKTIAKRKGLKDKQRSIKHHTEN